MTKAKKVDPNDGLKAAAILTIHKPGAMSKHGREEIARWLRRCANDLVKLGSDYNATGRFIARYYVLPLNDDPYAKDDANENGQGQAGQAAPVAGSDERSGQV